MSVSERVEILEGMYKFLNGVKEKSSNWFVMARNLVGGLESRIFDISEEDFLTGVKCWEDLKIGLLQ